MVSELHIQGFKPTSVVLVFYHQLDPSIIDPLEPSSTNPTVDQICRSSFKTVHYRYGQISFVRRPHPVLISSNSIHTTADSSVFMLIPFVALQICRFIRFCTDFVQDPVQFYSIRVDSIQIIRFVQTLHSFSFMLILFICSRLILTLFRSSFSFVHCSLAHDKQIDRFRL